MRRTLLGSAVAFLTLAALTGLMIPLRQHLSVATPALVLVIPVVASVAVGGLGAGLLAVAAGFLAYDFVFIPPYYTLAVGRVENWVALAVYAVVMLLTAQVVARFEAARSETQLRADVTRRLFELSELLVTERPLAELIQAIVMTVWQAFELDGAALFLSVDGVLQMVASVGEPFSDQDLRGLAATSGVPVPVGVGSEGAVRVVALAASGRPVGLLALRGIPELRASRDLIQTFANHLALAIERTQLRDQAVRAQLLEESDRWRRSLVGAVSHDLRTPLATIKVAASSLRNPDADLSSTEAIELATLIDDQTDRLDRLVANLLDMTRIQTGAFRLRRETLTVPVLVTEALAALGRSVGLHDVDVDVPKDLPAVDVDPVLVVQVLTNLIDNAARYSPEESTITVAAREHEESVQISVTDGGPGVAPEERETIFQMFNHSDAGGRAGLGLAIVKAFVEAHGQHVWVQEAPGGGAQFVFSVPRDRPNAGTP